MITYKDAIEKYGKPDLSFEYKHMTVFRPSEKLRSAIPKLPKAIYLNKDLKPRLKAALEEIAEKGLGEEIHSWDGCFNIRIAKGYNNYSLHSWGIAIDINAKTNGWNEPPQLNREIVKIFKKHGFDWGGDWNTPDGMHFQLKCLCDCGC